MCKVGLDGLDRKIPMTLPFARWWLTKPPHPLHRGFSSVFYFFSFSFDQEQGRCQRNSRTASLPQWWIVWIQFGSCQMRKWYNWPNSYATDALVLNLVTVWQMNELLATTGRVQVARITNVQKWSLIYWSLPPSIFNLSIKYNKISFYIDTTIIIKVFISSFM